uniref:RNase H type-1 domain-containing protein n=1 Tax=Cannabis sativa TaxID=3483 RepID=A0A803NSE2_CANSA
MKKLLISYWVASVECSKYCGSWGVWPTGRESLGLVCKISSEFQQANGIVLGKDTRGIESVDTASCGVITINVDACHRMEDKSATTGIVIRGNDGVVQDVRPPVTPITTSPLIAELYAIRDGIRTGIQRRLPRFRIESNCLCAVQLILDKEEGCQDVDGLLHEVRLLTQHPSVAEIKFVYRECNQVAHLLANYDLVNKVSVMWIGVSPLVLVELFS